MKETNSLFLSLQTLNISDPFKKILWELETRFPTSQKYQPLIKNNSLSYHSV